MMISIPRPSEIEVTHIGIDVDLRDDVDDGDVPKDLPLLDDRGGWSVRVEIDTGKVSGWPAGKTAELHVKVVDAGTYTLYGPDCDVLAERMDYVPSFFPGNHYGDYLILNIGPDGVIADWSADGDDILEAFFPDEN